MNLRHGVHISTRRRKAIRGGSGDVFAGASLVSSCFEIQAEIEMGVELS